MSKLQLNFKPSNLNIINLVNCLKQKRVRLSKASFSRECENNYPKPQRSGATLSEKSQEQARQVKIS